MVLALCYNEFCSIYFFKSRSEVITMKKGIHPTMHKTKITCTCGNEIDTLSTKENIRVEICAACHPFYTGSRSRVSEKGGRVERFRKRYGM